jgi:hypothetical protein
MSKPHTITQYAVRVKGTQCYLPRPQRRDGRGGSHLEPVDFRKLDELPSSRYSKDMLIRTFATERAAKNLLTSWLKGRFFSDHEGDVWNNKEPDRRAENMEVVAILLELPPP